MKRFCALSLVAGMLGLGSAYAAPITITLEGGSGYGPYQTGVGGEFTFRIDQGSLISGYAAATHDILGGSDVSFQTFCVEGNEYIYPYGVYTAVGNDHSVYGNVHLSVGAAWLYSQFATGGNFGGLATYAYGGGSGRHTTAGELQNAIWALMGGQEGQTAANNAGNQFLIAAENAFGGTFLGADAPATIGVNNNHVYVLNLWDTSGRAAQDQLIYTTGPIPNVIPDGGMTAMLLGFGLTGLGFVSRRGRR
jgi:hypothetical protein